MARLRFPFRYRGIIFATHDSGCETSLATRRRKRPGQHYLQSPASRTFPLRVLNEMTEEDAKALFQELRWAQTGGKPVCSHCGHTEAWILTGEVKRFKFKAPTCRRLFAVTSGTIFASHHMSFKDIITGLRAFTLNAKGYSAIVFSK